MLIRIILPKILYLSLIFLNLQSIFCNFKYPQVAIGYHIKKGIIESIIPWASIKTPSFVIIWQNMLILQDLPKKGIEMSVVLGRYAREFQYPTPFEVHYSELYKGKYLKNNNFICGNGVDKDLAAHMTMVYHRGICLYGKEIKDAFVKIPKKYYVDSILFDNTGV